MSTIIIGGGQAGLVTGYHLQQLGEEFEILEASDRIGQSWRARWDSLRLFTPARYDGLDGMKMDLPKHTAPTKDEMAAYLEAYAERFALPVRTGARVERIARDGERFVVETSDGARVGDNVVVATGAFQVPRVPAFATNLDPQIRQLHSSDYKRPSQLQPGAVLVVGVGNSGADICIDVAETHETWLAGKEHGHVPFRIDSFKARFLIPIVRFVGQHVLSLGTPIGRKARAKFHGPPLVRVKPKDIVAAGVHRVGRVTGVRDGLPELEDGTVLDVANVIWCTGFGRDYSWLEPRALGSDGEPLHERGVSTTVPGLYFVGLPFQYSATSETLPGMSRDARYVARAIMRVSPKARALVGA
jgi:putative flavoprotein involved in K+ transport